MSLLVAAFLFGLTATTVLAEEWRLMGRHGDCLRLAEAAKRKDVLKDVASPQDFTAQMRRQGKPVKTTDLPGGAVLLEAAGLSLVFVPAKSCPAP